MKTTDGDVYREAARIVHEGKITKLSCTAVVLAARRLRVSDAREKSLLNVYNVWLSKQGDGIMWITDFEMENRKTLPPSVARMHRALALCLAAAMADAGDLL